MSGTTVVYAPLLATGGNGWPLPPVREEIGFETDLVDDPPLVLPFPLGLDLWVSLALLVVVICSTRSARDVGFWSERFVVLLLGRLRLA